MDWWGIGTVSTMLTSLRWKTYQQFLLMQKFFKQRSATQKTILTEVSITAFWSFKLGLCQWH